MKFEIDFTNTATNQIRTYTRFEQVIILDGIAEPLPFEPTTETRNRKRLGDNEWSDWELRVQKYRVFYDVIIEADRQSVKIKAVGHKEHNTLYTGGKEVQL